MAKRLDSKLIPYILGGTERLKLDFDFKKNY